MEWAGDGVTAVTTGAPKVTNGPSRRPLPEDYRRAAWAMRQIGEMFTRQHAVAVHRQLPARGMRRRRACPSRSCPAIYSTSATANRRGLRPTIGVQFKADSQ